jgi:hypothetical protein
MVTKAEKIKPSEATVRAPEMTGRSAVLLKYPISGSKDNKYAAP